MILAPTTKESPILIAATLKSETLLFRSQLYFYGSKGTKSVTLINGPLLVFNKKNQLFE